MGLIIRTAERERNKGDYQDFFVVSKDEALNQLNDAKMFHNRVLDYLKTNYEIGP